MASSKQSDCDCLICVSIIPNQLSKQVDRLDAIFLLRILFEIPEEEKLVDNIKDFINSIQICEHCQCEIKQCKQIYSEICEKVKGFRECQNKILDEFSKDQNQNSSKRKKDDYDSWVVQCRQFIKDRDINGLVYPFAVQDLETLQASIQSKDVINCAFKNELSAGDKLEIDDDSIQMSEDPFDEINSPFILPSEEDSLPVKQEPESEEDEAGILDDDDFNLNEDEDHSSDNDSDHQPSPSKKPKLFPTKRRSPKKCVIQVKKQSTQIKKGGGGRHSKNSTPGDYPDFKRDPITKKFHCTWENCSQQFVEKNWFQYHYDKHRGTPRQKCGVCLQAFYTHKEVARHRQVEHPTDGDNFDCEKCGKKCYFREAYTSHLRSYHGEKWEKRRIARMKEQEEDPIKQDPVTKRWVCRWPECNKSYMARCALSYHLDEHKGTPNQRCEECGELFYKRQHLIEHREKVHQKDRKYACEICGDIFDSRNNLYGHKSYKHSEKGTGVQVVCEICGKSYTKAGLYYHMKNVHGSVEERKYVCHLCPGKFGDGRGLKRHLWWVHEYCEREEDKEKFVKEREKGRERGRNWTCHVRGCRQKFVSEEGWRRHVEEVHKGKWGEKEDNDGRYKCEVCGKGFHMKQKMTRHAKLHEKK